MKCLGAYITLLFCLSVVGGFNQGLYNQQESLIEKKAQLQAQIRELRAEAAPINGPLAVNAWARAKGMVPATQVLNSQVVAPGPGPQVSKQSESVEVYTLWR